MKKWLWNITKLGGKTETYDFKLDSDPGYDQKYIELK